MCEKAEVLELLDPSGRKVKARRISFYESIAWMQAGGMATSYITELADGTRLYSMEGDKTLLDSNTGAIYKRVFGPRVEPPPCKDLAVAESK